MRRAVFFLMMVIAAAAHAGDRTYGDAAVLAIRSVYDGDTFRCDIEGPPIIGEDMPVRIHGIDTPEIRGSGEAQKALAMKAKAFTAAALAGAKAIRLRNMRRGKYFRILADVDLDGKDLGRMLMDAGLARPYDGGKRPAW